MLLSFCFLFLHWVMFCSGRVRQVVVLYSNDCMKICWVRLSIGRLRRVIILQRWLLTGLTVPFKP